MRRWHSVRGDDGSLMLAIMLTMLLAGFSGLLLTMTIGQDRSVQHDQRFTDVFPAADAGISRGLFMLNNGLATVLPSPSQCTQTTVPDVCKITLSGQNATWYGAQSTPVSTTSPPSYDLTAQTTGTTVRTLKAQAYQSARFGYGLFADQSLVFAGSNHVYSYNSNTGTVSTTGQGSVGSNGSVTINGNSNADSVTLYNWNGNPNNARCNGGPCSSGYTTKSAPLDISSTAATQFIQNGLAACTTQTAFKTSTVSTHALPAGTWCASSLNLDADTTVTGPTVIYVSGNITLGAHLNINYSSGSTPFPANLQIYSVGTSVDMSNHTNAAGAIYAPLASCTGGAQDVIYGSLTCGSIRNPGGWTLYYDEALGAVGAGDFRIRNYREN
jgi:hypothetical protein